MERDGDIRTREYRVGPASSVIGGTLVVVLMSLFCFYAATGFWGQRDYVWSVSCIAFGLLLFALAVFNLQDARTRRVLITESDLYVYGGSGGEPQRMPLKEITGVKRMYGRAGSGYSYRVYGTNGCIFLRMGLEHMDDLVSHLRGIALENRKPAKDSGEERPDR